MKYRNLGRTGVKVSQLCLGCMNFGSKTSNQESTIIINHAINAGINFLDTANIYNQGKSEEVIGDALKQTGKRNQILLATKVHGQMDDNDPNAQGNSRRHIFIQCEASLKRLKTDWIDLYQIHRPQLETPIDETLQALDDLIRQGKVRYVGTSGFAAWQIMESLKVSRELKLNRFVCEQPPYNLLHRRIERELIPFAQTYDIAIIPFAPLASGMLTGKYRRGQPRPKGSRFEEVKQDWANQNFFSDVTFDILEAIDVVAKEKGCPVSQLSLSWCMNQTGITCPIIGPRTLEQLEDNLGAIDVELTDEDSKLLNEICHPGAHVFDYPHETVYGPQRYRI